MLTLDSVYYVVVGNYGSGKTELSLALARARRKRCSGEVALVDLDIVNPYFRSAEHADLLRQEGIEVKMPSFALSTVDIPALPAEIQSVFEPGRYAHVVIDVGGDDVGATALGRYVQFIQPIRAQMRVLYVINPFRPLSGTEDDICNLFERIAQRARLRPDALVNNANLQRQTSANDLVAAQSLVEKVSARLALPVEMVTGYERFRADLPAVMQQIFFPLEPLMLPDWLEDDLA